MSEEKKTKLEEQDLENPTSEKEEQVSESPKEKEEEESLESSTFLKAVANDERINNPLRLGATAGNEYGWRSIPDRVIWLPSTTGPLANGVHPNTLQDNPEYLDTIDSWQIDDGPPDTLV